MSPGPVSDSYDPEFGTSANADLVRDAMRYEIRRIDKILGPERKDIVGVVAGAEPGKGKHHAFSCTEQDLRVLRYALYRALESI